MRIRVDIKGVILKPAFAAAVMGLATYVFYYLSFYVSHSNTISVLLSVLLSALVYFLALAAIGGIYRDDLEQIPGGKRLAKLLNGLVISSQRNPS